MVYVCVFVALVYRKYANCIHTFSMTQIGLTPGNADMQSFFARKVV